MWFLAAVTGYFLLAVVLVLDKMILSKSVGKPAVYTFYSTVFLLAAFAAWPFGVLLPTNVDILWSLMSGMTFGLAMYTMFVAVKSGEASHIDPFLGGVITIATYIFSFFLLGEHLSRAQIGGVMILSFAALLLSFEKSKKHHGFHAGFLWGILSGVLFAISLVGAKHIYDNYNFLTGLVWTRGTPGFFGLLLFASPAVRQSVFGKKSKKKKKTYGKQHAFGIVLANKILSVVGIVLVHYSIAIGSVTLVNALAGVEYVFMFCIIFFLTKSFPKVMKEYFTKSELVVEVIAIVLVAIGSAFFVL